MSPDQYEELVTFIARRFERSDADRLAFKVEMRAFVGVSVEALQSGLRAVAEHVLANGRRIDENGRRIDAVVVRLDRLDARVEALSGRFESG